MKVLFYVGELPTSTFIHRLALGLSAKGLRLILFGLKKRNFKKEKSIYYLGPSDSSKEGRKSKLYQLVKYSLLLTLFQNKQKKLIDKCIRERGFSGWKYRSNVYAISYQQPDIIHLQWLKAISHYYWVKDLGIKLVVSLRGSHLNYSPVANQKLAEEYRDFFPLVDGFHCVSQAILEEGIQYGVVKEKSKVIYSGLVISDFSFNLQDVSQKYSNVEKINIISIGRSHWVKGYNYALDAISELKKTYSNFSYTIIGAANEEELLFQVDALGLKEDVKLEGNVPFSEVKKRLTSSHILLLPSVSEGVANVVLEAMALGVLVVSTDVGGMREVVKHGKTGFLAENRNPIEIAEQLLECIKFPLEQKVRMLKEARDLIEEQHNHEQMVQQMVSFYEEICQ